MKSSFVQSIHLKRKLCIWLGLEKILKYIFFTYLNTYFWHKYNVSV